MHRRHHKVSEGSIRLSLVFFSSSLSLSLSLSRKKEAPTGRNCPMSVLLLPVGPPVSIGTEGRLRLFFFLVVRLFVCLFFWFCFRCLQILRLFFIASEASVRIGN